jgi:hypothetical protein
MHNVQSQEEIMTEDRQGANFLATVCGAHDPQQSILLWNSDPSALPPSPSILSPSGSLSRGGLLEELKGQGHERDQEGKQVNGDPDISMGFEPKFTPP